MGGANRWESQGMRNRANKKWKQWQCLQTFLDKHLLENDDLDIFHWYCQELHNSRWELPQEEELLPNEDSYFAVLVPDTTSEI